jgi:two-component system sensor histidine kinase UhpB
LLGELQAAVTDVSEDVRRLSHELHPSLLHYTGLTMALRSLCQAQPDSLHVHAELEELPELPLNVATALYRIAQESLRNVEKHANASQVVVRLNRVGADIQLEIGDDGIGLDDHRHDAPRGLGLLSMRERAREIGGELRLVSGLHGGTRVIARVAGIASQADKQDDAWG